MSEVVSGRCERCGLAHRLASGLVRVVIRVAPIVITVVTTHFLTRIVVAGDLMQAVLEAKVAALEGGTAALAVASGHGAQLLIFHT